VLLASSALAAISFGPTASGPDVHIAYPLLVGYVAFALFCVVLLRLRPQGWRFSGLAMHVVDVAAAAAVTQVTTGPNSPFFMLFLFTLLSAAYRWGFAETVATAAAAVLFLLIEAAPIGSVLHGAAPFQHAPFEADRLIMRSSYLLLAGILTGYLAQSEKQLRSEATAISAIISQADVRRGLKRTMAAVFDTLLRIFAAHRVLVVVREKATNNLFRWDGVRSVEGSLQDVRFVRLESDDLSAYMFAPAAAAWDAVPRRGRSGKQFDVVALDRGGSRVSLEAPAFSPEFLEAVGPFARLMAFGIELGNEWTGRLFLIDPRIGADRSGVLGFGLRVVRRLAPAVQNVFLMHRLRSAATAIERARIARELHDGVIQTVTAVEMQVAALSIGLAKESPRVANELRRLDTVLREEVVRLRELMQQMKPVDLSPDQFVDALSDFVQRFERETGIAARFVTKLDRVALPPRSCREVARILHEALVNVRRHSGAQNVFVRLATVNGDCHLSIDDDGCGFPFRGRLSQADLEAARDGPLVIKERVRLIGGELTIESDPGRGARLEIAVPLMSHGIQR
jgi:signal transduction histidine kinase